jgi:hypothetical protein
VDKYRKLQFFIQKRYFFFSCLFSQFLVNKPFDPDPEQDSLKMLGVGGVRIRIQWIRIHWIRIHNTAFDIVTYLVNLCSDLSGFCFAASAVLLSTKSAASPDSLPSSRVMSSPFLHKTIFFSESCLGDLMLYGATKFNLKRTYMLVWPFFLFANI